MKLKAFLVRCTCPGDEHDDSRRDCPTEMFMRLVLTHNLFPHLVHDVLDCEALDAPIEGVDR